MGQRLGSTECDECLRPLAGRQWRYQPLHRLIHRPAALFPHPIGDRQALLAMPKSKPASVKESWSRINQWLRANKQAAPVAEKLLPGVPEKALAKVEKALKKKLPPDLREFWQLCGGSRPDPEAEAGETSDESWWQPGEWSSDIFPRSIPEIMAFSVLSPRAALEAWENLQEWDGFKRDFLPIAGDGGGDYQCVNLSAKSTGQIVEWAHEEGDAKVLAPSLASFLHDLADGLKTDGVCFQADNRLVRLSCGPPIKKRHPGFYGLF